MAEQQKNQIGDGQDNYAGAAKQMANAAKQASKTAATRAATMTCLKIFLLSLILPSILM